MKIPFKKQGDAWDSIKILPLLENLKGYNSSALVSDARAGFNVAVLSFPVNMAYAMVAGLPISYGIFAGIVASLMGLLFSRGTYVTFGPSNATAVILFSSFASMGIATEAERMAVLPALLFLVGLILVIASVFKLTFLISYISRTVIVAYITVGALLIAANQMKNLLGFSYPDNAEATSLVDIISLVIAHAKDAQFSSVAMAVFTFAIFIPLKKYARKLPAEGITLMFIALVCWVLKAHFKIEIDTLSSVSVTEWGFSIPDFDIVNMRSAGLAAVAIAMLCAIEAVSIGKSLAAEKSDRLDVNQEIFSMGMANIACGAASSTLSSGSMTRSTLAVASGVKTTVYNLFTAIFTLIILLVFGFAIEYVPRATLALVVVYTSVKLIKFSTIKIALKSTKSDASVFLVTFLVGVFSSLDEAIYAGMVMSIVLFLRKASAPEVVEYAIGEGGELELMRDSQKRSSIDNEISIVHVEGNMFFGASDVLQNQLRRISANSNLKILILKLRNAINIDATNIMDLEELSRRMKSSGSHLFLCEVRPDLMRMLKSSGAYNIIGKSFIFENDESNPTLSAARAIKEARKYMDVENAKVTIYTNNDEV